MQTLIDDYISPLLLSAKPDFTPLAHAIMRVGVFYLIGVIASFVQSRLMVYVTQGTLRNIRNDLFSHMESLPVKYFDTHAHGDIMSVYTNDADTLRQMISPVSYTHLGGIFLCGILAAIMSTADSQLLVCASSVSKDIYKNILKPDAPDDKVLKISRITVLVIAVLAFIIAWNPDSSIMGLSLIHI